jgi:cytochrome c biogenesis protein CcdA
MDNIRKHFELASSAGDSTNGTAGVLVNRTEKAQTLSATFVEVPEQKEHAQALKLIYFTSPGCAECERVERLLPQVKECFQWLQIETRDIKKVASMQYNEALCERFGVPEKDRLITPVVFAGGGYLLKKDITFEGLGELLTRSAMVSTDWSAIPQEKLAAADTAITQRYSAVTPLVIIGNGLSDGINPCAFATIIFLVSYLQIARRTPKETAQVALAFIAAVFLAYFVLGLGLAEIIARLMVLKRIGLAINWAMAGLVLVLLILNLRDGVLCLQGRLNETVLQLPGFLKDRIHTTIRHGARQAKYVLAAFAMGVVISFLELACTGQVYLPTIGYMLKMKGPSTGIVWLLLLYNVAFIVPLLIIFIATYFGMTAERLTHILQKHAAAVKFATAILFLILLIMFIISSRISA